MAVRSPRGYSFRPCVSPCLSKSRRQRPTGAPTTPRVGGHAGKGRTTTPPGRATPRPGTVGRLERPGPVAAPTAGTTTTRGGAARAGAATSTARPTRRVATDAATPAIAAICGPGRGTTGAASRVTTGPTPPRTATGTAKAGRSAAPSTTSTAASATRAACATGTAPATCPWTARPVAPLRATARTPPVRPTGSPVPFSRARVCRSPVTPPSGPIPSAPCRPTGGRVTHAAPETRPTRHAGGYSSTPFGREKQVGGATPREKNCL